MTDDRPTASRTLRCSSAHLATGLLFLAVALLACLSPTQSDTWWHLRAGQDIVSTGTLSLHDTYSHTAAGGFWPNHEWLTEMLFYGLYQLGGLPLLTLVCAGAIVTAWALSWRLAAGSFEVRFVLFTVALASATTHWAVRPQVLSMALLTATVSLLVSGRSRWLPLLFVVWTNLHGAVALGVVVVLAALVASTAVRRALPRALAITAVGCLLATMLSPLGPRFWIEILRSIQRSQINQLVEWRPPGAVPALWPFWAIAAGLIVFSVLRRRRLDDRSAMLTAIAISLLPFALRAVRNVPVFLLIAVPALATLGSLDGRPVRVRRVPKEHDRVNAAILGVGGAIGMIVVVFLWHAPAPLLGWRPIGSAAVEAITSCPAPLYNTYEQGGILIWFAPEQRVFIDNRQDPYPMDLLRASRQLELDGDYTALFSRYGIRCAVVPPESPTAQRLSADSAWSLRYADDRWAVYR